MSSLLNPLSKKPLFILWLGQLFSAFGDEAYKVALITLAVQLAGADAGFLAALQAGSAFFFSIIGSAWADRWRFHRTLIFVDGLRAVIVCIPLLSLCGMPLTLTLLMPMAVLVSGLSAFFDPALVAVLPEITSNRRMLHAANAWLDATRRLARVGGPLMVAVLGSLIPIVHFFTLDAVSFLLSALSIFYLANLLLRRQSTPANENLASRNPWAEWKKSYELAGAHPMLRYSLFCSGVSWALWSLAFLLGGALLFVGVGEKQSTRDYGFLICAYGVGNVISNLYWGNRRIVSTGRVLFGGFVVLGLGFIGVALANSFPLRLFFAAFAAFGGPMDDLSFLTILQNEYRGTQIAKLFRLLMVTGQGLTLVAFLISPWLYRRHSPENILTFSGFILVALGTAGAVRFFHHRTQSAN